MQTSVANFIRSNSNARILRSIASLVRLFSLTANYCEGYQLDADEHWQTTSPEYKWLRGPGRAPRRGQDGRLPLPAPLGQRDPAVGSLPPRARTSLESLLSANGVPVAFNGHAHTYQGIRPSGRASGQLRHRWRRRHPRAGARGLHLRGPRHRCLGTGQGHLRAGVGPDQEHRLGLQHERNRPGARLGVRRLQLPQRHGQRRHGHRHPLQRRRRHIRRADLHLSATPGPSTPTSVTAAATSTSSVDLHWSASTEVGGSIASYRIYRNGSEVATVGASASSFTDNGAQQGTTYAYSVAAVDAGGQASWPGLANLVTTPGQPRSSPGSGQPGCATQLPSGAVVGAAALDDGSGYYEVDRSGDVAAFGAAVCYGGMTGTPLNRPIVGMAVDPATGGYWLVASDGGVFSSNAPFEGSTGGLRLNQPIVGMGATPDGSGYWLVASDGGVFSFNATFYGGTGLMKLNRPIVGMAVDRTTGGYWLVASDGGVFNFNAPFDGATGGMKLNQPIVGIDATSDGSGYRLVAADGGVFTGFNTPFYGGTGLIRLNRPIITTIPDNDGDGYWLVASDGGVFSFHAPFYGSAAG